MQYQALNKQVILTLEDLAEESIIVSPNKTPKVPYGLVVSVGVEVTACIPGDKVLFLPNASMELPALDKGDPKRYLSLHQDSVFAKLIKG